MNNPRQIDHLNVNPVILIVNSRYKEGPRNTHIPLEAVEGVLSEVLITKRPVSGVPRVPLPALVTLVHVTIIPLAAWRGVFNVAADSVIFTRATQARVPVTCPGVLVARAPRALPM